MSRPAERAGYPVPGEGEAGQGGGGEARDVYARGRCLCGSFGFVARGEAARRIYCHCVDCRRATGAPVSVLVGYQEQDVEYTGQSPKRYRSSETVARTFCGECGGSVSYEDDLLPGEVYLHVGLFDEPERLSPQAHSWLSQAIDWLRLEDELPRHQTSSRPRSR